MLYHAGSHDGQQVLTAGMSVTWVKDDINEYGISPVLSVDGRNPEVARWLLVSDPPVDRKLLQQLTSEDQSGFVKFCPNIVDRDTLKGRFQQKMLIQYDISGDSCMQSPFQFLSLSRSGTRNWPNCGGDMFDGAVMCLFSFCSILQISTSKSIIWIFGLVTRSHVVPYHLIK